MSAPGGPPADRAALAIVYLTVFIDLLGFGIILPSLPYYARDLGATGLDLGILFSAYSVAQLAGSALLGRLSDHHGRRPILLLSLAGSAASMFLSGLAGGLAALSLARALAGVFGGSIGTAQAYIADVTPRAERARYMGLLGAAIGVGFVLGPALGAGLLALGFGFRGAAFAAGGLAALNFASALVRLPESRRSDPAAERVTSPRAAGGGPCRGRGFSPCTPPSSWRLSHSWRSRRRWCSSRGIASRSTTGASVCCSSISVSS
jgi:DHA1 family tetracycline resistance protein-like MFS transporter